MGAVLAVRGSGDFIDGCVRKAVDKTAPAVHVPELQS